MGFVGVTVKPGTIQAWFDVFILMDENADFVLQHANMGDDDWTTFKEGIAGNTESIEILNFISGMSNNNNLEVFAVIDPLIPDRTEHTIPYSVRNDFGNVEV